MRQNVTKYVPFILLSNGDNAGNLPIESYNVDLNVKPAVVVPSRLASCRISRLQPARARGW